MCKKTNIAQLQELAEPLVEHLRENYGPYHTIIITGEKIQLVRDEIGIPLKDKANP